MPSKPTKPTRGEVKQPSFKQLEAITAEHREPYIAYGRARNRSKAGKLPAEHVERPRRQPPRWRVLEPTEVARVAPAFSDERARAVFLTLVLTRLRKHELRGLPWRDISFADEALRVRKSKSRAGERAIALPARSWRRAGA
jgi:integrase